MGMVSCMWRSYVNDIEIRALGHLLIAAKSIVGIVFFGKCRCPFQGAGSDRMEAGMFDFLEVVSEFMSDAPRGNDPPIDGGLHTFVV